MVVPAGEAQAAMLRPLLEARHVAIMGASARPGSFGNALVRQVLAGGFAGSVQPVNPRYREVQGLRCVPSLADLPHPAELALLAVGPDRVEAQLQAAADAGTRAAVVYTSLPGADLNARLQAVASAAGMAVCGANCMGFVNLERSLRACAYTQPRDLRPGPVTFISHSGSAFSSLLHSHRGVRYNLVVSAGTEFSVSMDGYLDYALGLPSTRAIGLFMETSRNPAGLRRALHRAAEQDVPVVCLKVGRDARSRQFVATHTGALAGEDAAYDAVFAAYGVLRVADLDEMMDTLEPVQQPEVAPAVTRRWRSRLASPAPLTASESFQLLADYGIPVAPTLPAASLPEAITAAERIGWPVALKTAATGVVHKSDAGGVRLGITDAGMLVAAYAEMSHSFGPEVTVSAMVPPGAELALGIVRDPQFGPLVMAGAGGVLVELHADRVFGLPPLNETRAQDMLGRLKTRRLLDGFRRTPASNVASVADTIVRLSALAADAGDLIAGLDINPLIAGPSGCVAVDVLVAHEHPHLANGSPRLCCICVTPGCQRAAQPRLRGGTGCRRRRRTENPGGGQGHGAAEGGRFQHHAAHSAGTRPGVRHQPQYRLAPAAHPGASRPG
jgi:acyl-CoA synthetase (NDP forming)